MKTRQEIVEECVQAANACWNHYADESLGVIYQVRLLSVLDKAMPQSVSTKD